MKWLRALAPVAVALLFWLVAGAGPSAQPALSGLVQVVDPSELVAIVLAGPDPEASGISAYTREEWCASARSGSAGACM